MPKSRTSRALTGPALASAPAVAVLHLVRLLELWRKRLRCRRELSALTLEQLRDVGLDPALVRREYAKPFWKA